MAEELRIIIDANVDGAKKGLNDVTVESDKTVNSLSKLPVAANSASAGLDKLGSSAASVAPSTTQASSGAQKLVSSLVKLPPLANSSAESTKKFVTQLKETNSVLINVANGTPRATQQITKLQIGVSHLGDSLETLKAKANVTRDFINTERDVTKIAILQKQLQALEAEILRVQNIGKTGIIPTEVSEQAFSGLISGANTAFTALRRIAFVLPGIGIAGILGGLSDTIISLAKDLLNLADSFDEAEIQAAQFQNQLKSLNDFIESTKGELDFSSEIAKLKNQLTLGPGFQTDILGKAIDVKTAETKLKNLNTVVDIQFDKLNHLLGNATNVLSANGKKLFDTFGGQPELISDELIQKLSKNDQTFLTNIKTLSTDIEKINKERGETQRQIEILNTQKQVDVHNQQLKEQKDFHDKQLKESQEFLEKVNRQTIALAKEAEKVFNIPLTLKFDETDLDFDKLQKAKDVLAGIRDFTIKARIDIVLPDIKELPKEQVDKFFINVPDALQDAINKGLIEKQEGITLPVKLALDPEHAFDEDINKLEAKFHTQGLEIPVEIQVAIAEGTLKGVDLLSALLKAFKPAELEKKLNEQLQQAIDNAFKNISTEGFASIGEAIGAAIGGGDISKAFKQFGQTLGSAVEALGKQIIALGAAALLTKNALKALFANPALAIAAGVALVAIGAAIKAALGNGLQGFEKGGRPPVGEWVLVGEKGPELFKADRPGTILTNQQSKSILASSVRENQSIKEYFITEKFNQALKEHTSKVSDSIKESIKIALVPVHTQLSETIKSISASNEKLTAYSYKLHEVNNSNIQSIKERFVESNSISDKVEFNKLISSVTKVFNEKTFKESQSKDNHEKEVSFNNLLSSLKESVVNITLSDKIDYFKESFTSELKKASENYVSVKPEAKGGMQKQASTYEYKESFEKLITSFRDQFRNNIESSVSNNILSNILQRYENSQLQSLKENGFSSNTISNKSFNRITYSFTDYKLINNFDKLKESESFTDKLVNNFSDLKESFKQDNLIKSFIENSSLKQTGFESFIEKLNSTFSDKLIKFTDSTSTKEVFKDSDSLKFITNNILKSVFESSFGDTSTEILKSVFKTFSDSSYKIFNGLKETFTIKERFSHSSFKQLNDNVINENYSHEGFKESVFNSKEILSILRSEKTNGVSSIKTFSDSFERITSDIKNVISKIQIDKTTESYRSDLNSFTEKISNSVSNLNKESYKSELNSLSEKINNSFSKLDKVTERINSSSVKSFSVEKIINNNFITKDSFRETLKSLSLATLQKEFHIPAFASGGAVFGPTLAILGEGFGISRSNPEFVGTASQLKGVQGGTFDVNVSVDGELSFSMGKLALALNREVRSSIRTNGKKPF